MYAMSDLFKSIKQGLNEAIEYESSAIEAGRLEIERGEYVTYDD
jgi:predicted transcriptional regulator